jgi:hypothetical protein
MRRKIPQLTEALTGYFNDEHAQLAHVSATPSCSTRLQKS